MFLTSGILKTSLLVRHMTVTSVPKHRCARRIATPKPIFQTVKKEDFHEFDPEDLEDNDEADFMNVGKMYSQHKYEIKRKKEHLKYTIVRSKYFKDPGPNFLTWNDKQHMKYLHERHPDEWTVQKLSESFPALPSVVAKIVTSEWTPKDDKRIAKHDESVLKNWESFKAGNLHVSDELQAHLDKFSNRSFAPSSINSPVKLVKKVVRKSDVANEFSDIISSYKSEQMTTEDKDKLLKTTEMSSSSEKFRDVKHNRKGNHEHVTFAKLKESIHTSLEKGENQSELDKLILRTNYINISESRAVTSSVSDQMTEVKPVDSTLTDNIVTEKYPEKISIPKKAWKKGRMYQLNDCFYTDDGLFLYRVPGLK